MLSIIRGKHEPTSQGGLLITEFEGGRHERRIVIAPITAIGMATAKIVPCNDGSKNGAL